MMFAIVGTFVSTFFFALSTYALFKMGWIKRTAFGKVPLDDCLMYGALLSATDTIATLSVFSDLRAPQEIYNLVFGESVLNDAISILVFSTVAETYGEDFNTAKAVNMVGVLPGKMKQNIYLSCYLSGSLETVLLFSKLNEIFSGYFDPENIFVDNENK